MSADNSSQAAEPLQTPNAPSLLYSPKQTSTSITLTWKDNSDNETGFVVERKTTLGNDNFVRVAKLSVNRATRVSSNWISYTDKKFIVKSPRNLYTYRVAACNGARANFGTEVILPFNTSKHHEPNCLKSGPENTLNATPETFERDFENVLSGQTIKLSPGLYEVKNPPLTIKSGVIYCGNGATLYMQPGQFKSMLKGDTLNNVTIEHFVFDGGAIELTGVNDHIIITRNTFTNNRINLAPLEFESWKLNYYAGVVVNPKNGILRGGIRDSQITNNIFFNIGAGLSVNFSECSNTQISNNLLIGIWQGISTQRASGSEYTIRNNTFLKISRMPIELQTGTNKTITVANNLIDDWVPYYMIEKGYTWGGHMAISAPNADQSGGSENLYIKHNVILGRGEGFPNDVSTYDPPCPEPGDVGACNAFKARICQWCYTAIEASSKNSTVEDNFAANWASNLEWSAAYTAYKYTYNWKANKFVRFDNYHPEWRTPSNERDIVTKQVIFNVGSNGEVILDGLIREGVVEDLGTVVKLKISKVGSDGATILDGLIKRAVVEDVSATKMCVMPYLEQKESIVKEVAKGGIVAKLTIEAVSKNGKEILKELINKHVVFEDMVPSPEVVRVPPYSELKPQLKIIKEIAKDDSNKIWAILYHCHDDFNRVWAILKQEQEVRLMPYLAQKQSIVRGIAPDNFEQIWAILQRSQNAPDEYIDDIWNGIIPAHWQDAGCKGLIGAGS